MREDPSVDVDRFWQEGFQIIRNVFDPDEVASFRRAAYQTLDADRTTGLVQTEADIITSKGDLLSKPLLRPLILDPRILSVAKKILGGRPVYFGDSNFQTTVGADWRTPKGGHWHKDNRLVDRTNPLGLDWQGRYSVIRIGVYMQDHSRHSGALALRVGSHMQARVDTGKPVFAGTTVGDIVVWSLRTTHSGHSVRLRFMPNVKVPVQVESRIPRWLCVGHEAPRVACFLTYGLNDDHTRRYMEEFKNRDYGIDYLRCSRFGPDVWSEIEGKEQDLDIVRLIPEYGTLAS